MKSLLIYMINFIFTTLVYANVNLYYVENVVTIQNGRKFTYSIDYKVKNYNFDTKKFSETDICNSCKKPLKLVKSPLEKWVVVVQYKIEDSVSIKNKNELLNKLKENFKLKSIKKDSNNDSILSYYEVTQLQKPIKEKVASGVMILQKENLHSKKIIIPPNDNFILLKAMAIDNNNNFFKDINIKLTSSCGKLKIKDSSRFSFTFFNKERQCSIYAKLGPYIDVVDVIKLNKDGSMPSAFNILYKNTNVDKINIDYYTFKTKGIVLKNDSNNKELKWNTKDNDLLRIQVIKDGIIVYPKKRVSKYNIELIDIKKGLSDNIVVIIKNE